MLKTLYLPAMGRFSPKWKGRAKSPKGNAPIPNDIWKTPSAKFKPGKP